VLVGVAAGAELDRGDGQDGRRHDENHQGDPAGDVNSWSCDSATGPAVTIVVWWPSMRQKLRSQPARNNGLATARARMARRPKGGEATKDALVQPTKKNCAEIPAELTGQRLQFDWQFKL